MIYREINEFVRLIGSLSLDKAGKDRITDFLLNKRPEQKEFTVKYIAVASAVAVLTVGTILLTRGTKQDLNVM